MQILPQAILSIGSFLLAMLLFTKCRPGVRPLVTPLNWFLTLFCLELVVTPTVILNTGVSSEFLASAPSDFATKLALVLYTVGFWSFCIAIQVHRKRQPVLATSMIRRPADTWFPPRWMLVCYAILGIAGVLLFFKSPARLIMYFVSPQLYLSDAETSASGSVGDAASLFLRTFLPFSLVMLWCRGVAVQKTAKGLFARFRGPMTIFLVAVSAPLYSYERASLVIPMIAIAAVMLKQKGKAALLRVGGVLAVVVVFVLIITSYRKDPATAAGITKPASTADFYQLYGMGPQYLGTMLEKTHFGQSPAFGSVMLSSFLDPIPILGKPFRKSSGVGIFTNLTNRSEIPAPFTGEAFLDFNVLGVIAGFYLVGLLVAKLQNLFDRASEPLNIYVVQLSSVWLSYTVILGLEEVSIAVVYLLWPVYTFLLYRRWKKQQREDLAHLAAGQAARPA